MYEEAGVKEYWIVYTVEQCVDVFLLNPEGKFGGAALYPAGDKLAAATVPGFAINVDEIFTN